MRAGGSQRFSIRYIRSQVVRLRWLRRRRKKQYITVQAPSEGAARVQAEIQDGIFKAKVQTVEESIAGQQVSMMRQQLAAKEK